MADDIKEPSTYAVKLGGEVKQELLQLLEGYKERSTGANSGDFIKTLLEVYKTNKIVGNVVGGDAELKELNTITNRIYKIYSNLIDRNNTNNNSLQGEFAEQLTQKDITISNVKNRLEELKESNEVLEGVFNTVVEDKKELENTNTQLQKLNDSLEFNNGKLIEDNKSLHDFKEVNNKLSNEIAELKGLLADAQAKNLDKDNIIKNNHTNIDVLNKSIEKMKQENEKVIAELNKKNDSDILNLTGKLKNDNDSKILEIKTKVMEKIQDLNTKHNAEVETYQTKYKMLLEEMEQIRTIPKATKKDNAVAK